MSHANPIDLTGDSDGEAEQMEIAGASSGFLYVYTFASSTRGARARRNPSLFKFHQRSNYLFFLCLPASRFGLLPEETKTRAQRARENDGESTETWRVID